MIVVAFFLSLGAFVVLAAGEARAEQLPEAQQQQKLVVDGEVAKTGVDRTVDRKPPVERPTSKLSPTDSAPPKDSVPPKDSAPPPTGSAPSPAKSAPPPTPQLSPTPDTASQPEPVPEPPFQYDPGTPPADSDPKFNLPTPGEFGAEIDATSEPRRGLAPKYPFVPTDPTPAPEPVYSEPVSAIPKPVSERPVEVKATLDIPEEKRPFPSRVEEKLPVFPQGGVGQAPQPEKRPVTASPVGFPRSTADRKLEVRAPMVPYSPQKAVSGSLSNIQTAVSSAVRTLQSTAAKVLEPLAEDSSGASSPAEDEDPLENPPQPSSPLVPPVGYGFFSLSTGGGQAGPGAGITLLLLCVLASGLVLLRRDGRLWRAFCEVPKPSSALLTPLERPG